MLNFFFRFVFFIKVKNEEGNLMSCFFSVKSCFHFYQRFIFACVVLSLFIGTSHTHHSLGYMSAHLISGLVVAGWDLPGLILKHCQVPPVFKESKAPCAAK